MVSLTEAKDGIARVKEELTIQRVILRSLEDSGAPEEHVRQRVQQEITALKEKLRKFMLCTLLVRPGNAHFHLLAADSLLTGSFSFTL